MILDPEGLHIADLVSDFSWDFNKINNVFAPILALPSWNMET